MRLKERNSKMISLPPRARTNEEIEAMARGAERVMRHRRRMWLRLVISEHDYEMEDLAAVVADLSKVPE